MTENHTLYGDEPMLKKVARLSVPSVTAQVILVIYNAADTFFVGRTGNDAMLAALTVCMPAFMLLSAISNLFGVGGSGAIGRCLGRGGDNVRETASFSLFGCAAVSVVYCAAVGMLAHPLVDLMGGTDPAVHGYAVDYLRITVFIGGVPTAINGMAAHLVRASGHPVQAGAGTALGGVLNIVLDPIFMFRVLPPGMETTGAAVATALSNFIAFVYFIIVVNVNRKEGILWFTFGRRVLDGEVVRSVLRTGFSACMMTILENLSFAILDKLMSHYGPAIQAGLGAAKRINMLAHCIARGIAQGILPFISFCYAAGDRERMKKGALTATGLSAVVAVLYMTVSLVFANQLVGIFIPRDAASHALGAAILRIMCIGGPFSAWGYVSISVFQAQDDLGRAIILAALRKGIVDVPLMFILQSVSAPMGAVWAIPVADVICCIVAIRMFFVSMGRKRPPDGPDEDL